MPSHHRRDEPLPGARVAIALMIVAAVLLIVGCGGNGLSCAADDLSCGGVPTPTIASLSPASAVVGGAAFALTIDGSGFDRFSEVRWNGARRNTTFASASRLTASIGILDISSVGSADVTVFNSAPTSTRTATSNTLAFPIRAGGDAGVLGYVYVAGDLGVSEFAISNDGTLRLVRDQLAARSPGAGFSRLVVDPTHRYVYGLGVHASQIYQYRIEANGTLAEMNPLVVNLGDPSVLADGVDVAMAPGGSAVYAVSDRGVHQFGVGSDGVLRELAPPIGPGASCIAIAPTGTLVFTCEARSSGPISSYRVKADGTLEFLASSHFDGSALTDLGFDVGDDVVFGLHASANGPQLSSYAVASGVLAPIPASSAPQEGGEVVGIGDLQVHAGAAYALAGELIDPMPLGGGTKDHLSIYGISGGQLAGAPETRAAGRGPGRLLVLGPSAQTAPRIPNPLVYVTNSRDNNVAQCIPSAAPLCPTVPIVSTDKTPTGITGFLGAAGRQ
jgi:6-phosphogluconolactonase (cycloisomerase 2 family)